MMRNDYRRALILLRSNAPHCSGHVRLERRTLMGSMYFMVQAPEEYPVLRAALAGSGREGAYACLLGEMTRDSRGQAVLSCSFDPRNICGRELEQYQLLVVTAAGDENCSILLHGNMNGHAELNWERIRAALCALDQTQDEAPPAASLPEAEDMPQDEAPPEAVPLPLLPDETPAAEAQDSEACAQADESGAAEETKTPPPETAGKLLALDMELPWPEGVEPLRPLFSISVPMENPPDDEYVYIAAAMAPDSGYAHCAVGVLVRDGAPVSVRYGLPSRWSAEPPAGLEEYTWVGSGNMGWWMKQLDLQCPAGN